MLRTGPFHPDANGERVLTLSLQCRSRCFDCWSPLPGDRAPLPVKPTGHGLGPGRPRHAVGGSRFIGPSEVRSSAWHRRRSIEVYPTHDVAGTARTDCRPGTRRPDFNHHNNGPFFSAVRTGSPMECLGTVAPESFVIWRSLGFNQLSGCLERLGSSLVASCY